MHFSSKAYGKYDLGPINKHRILCQFNLKWNNLTLPVNPKIYASHLKLQIVKQKKRVRSQVRNFIKWKSKRPCSNWKDQPRLSFSRRCTTPVPKTKVDWHGYDYRLESFYHHSFFEHKKSFHPLRGAPWVRPHHLPIRCCHLLIANLRRADEKGGKG